jgi:hypothetical protein
MLRRAARAAGCWKSTLAASTSVCPDKKSPDKGRALIRKKRALIKEELYLLSFNIYLLSSA